DPQWRSYLTHLSLAGSFWLPMALLGVLVVLWRHRSLDRWAIPIGFGLAYFYVLATHVPVYGRYALPLLPGLCLRAAMPVIELSSLLEARLGLRWVAPALTTVGAAAMAGIIAVQSLEWVTDFGHADTRLMAASWMIRSVPKGSRVAVVG